MPDRTQDTEAIRAALGGEHAWRGGVEDARRVVVEAHAALGRLVARLEAAEQALRVIVVAEPQGLAGYDFAMWLRNIAEAALAAAAPGETTPVGKPPLDVAGILWVAAIDRVPLGERTDWVKATEKRVEAINEARAAPGETEQTP